MFSHCTFQGLCLNFLRHNENGLLFRVNGLCFKYLVRVYFVYERSFVALCYESYVECICRLKACFKYVLSFKMLSFNSAENIVSD